MKPSDTQIDVLIRRYAKGSETVAKTEHLDADELNAFAEEMLPAAVRIRYVAHLADCGDCRKLASQLAISAGAATKIQVEPSAEVTGARWWQRLNIFLAPQAMRYAAFAVVLMAVVGVAFIVFRRPNPPAQDLVARTEPPPASVNAEKFADATSTPADQVAKASAGSAGTLSQPSSNSKLNEKGYESESKRETVPPAPPKPQETIASEATRPAAVAERKAAETAVGQPSYAPPPPAEKERAATTRETQTLGRAQSGIESNESYNKYKVLDRARAADAAKDREDDRLRANRNAPTASEDKRDEQSRERRDKGNTNAGAGTGNLRMESRKAPPLKTGSEESPQTRSVGGRKFKRQGSAWIDLKFKSSMSVRNVARGSGEFADLETGLRSIAQQLGGEVIVVWKGKAYRIQ